MYDGIWPLTLIEKYWEQKWMRQADHITSVSQPLADTLSTKYGNKASVIYNGFDQEDYENLPKTLSFPEDSVVRIVYTGTIYAGKQDPSPLFQAISELQQKKQLTSDVLQVLFCGNNANVSELAESYQIADFVDYLGFLPRDRALCLQRDADVLLFLEFESEKVKGILTGKLFEYLFASPPILAVGIGADSSVGKVLNQTERGVAFGHDVAAIQRQLLQWLQKKRQGHPLSPHSVEEIRQRPEILQYSRQLQAERILGLYTLSQKT
jgi:glycosyltransferase involved in cell wall biosynthesis